MTDTVMEAQVSTEEINALIGQLGPVIQQHTTPTVQATLITLLLQNCWHGDVSDDDLIKGVQEISTLILLYCEKARLATAITGLQTAMTTPRLVVES